MANLNYLHPSSLVGVGQLSGDGGFGGLIADDVSGREDGLRLWEKKYQLQKQMLPAFVGETFGQKVRAPCSFDCYLKTGSCHRYLRLERA
jgi:gamma-tubulin complex component 3